MPFSLKAVAQLAIAAALDSFVAAVVINPSSSFVAVVKSYHAQYAVAGNAVNHSIMIMPSRASRSHALSLYGALPHAKSAAATSEWAFKETVISSESSAGSAKAGSVPSTEKVTYPILVSNGGVRPLFCYANNKRTRLRKSTSDMDPRGQHRENKSRSRLVRNQAG